MLSTARAALDHVDPKHKPFEDVGVNFAKPTWSRAKLNREDRMWIKELTTFGNLADPDWWAPLNPVTPIDWCFLQTKRCSTSTCVMRNGSGRMPREAA
jgi:hypothetical protein